MAKHALQPLASSRQESDRPLDTARGAFDLDHPPALLSVKDLAAIFEVTVSQAHRLHRLGRFDVFKVTPTIGPKQFSGALVARYLRGESLITKSYGRALRGV